MFEDHIAVRDCPKCGDEVTQKELVEHSWEHGEAVFENLFPEYYVCRVETPVYFCVEREVGPIYCTKESWDYVDETYMYELYRHDVERVDKEETPFPQYDEV